MELGVGAWRFSGVLGLEPGASSRVGFSEFQIPWPGLRSAGTFRGLKTRSLSGLPRPKEMPADFLNFLSRPLSTSCSLTGSGLKMNRRDTVAFVDARFPPRAQSTSRPQIDFMVESKITAQ